MILGLHPPTARQMPCQSQCCWLVTLLLLGMWVNMVSGQLQVLGLCTVPKRV